MSAVLGLLGVAMTMVGAVGLALADTESRTVFSVVVLVCGVGLMALAMEYEGT
jgi:hypothetical protein